MTATFNSQISPENIKVAYINPKEGLIDDVSVDDANTYEKANPDTVFIFVDGDDRINYLTIDQVNKLTPNNLVSTKSLCDTEPKPCGPPRIVIFGGEGIGAKANPIVSPGGAILGIDIIDGGYGYKTPPLVSVIDDCNNGSGAVIETEIDRGRVTNGIIKDTGTGYKPSQGGSSQYPVLLQLCRILVDNPGLNYSCGKDKIEVTPSNGIKLDYVCDPFGKIKEVKVQSCGIGYTSIPQITIKSDTGINASFIPVFTTIRDPLTLEVPPEQIVQVNDLVGLTKEGYVDGKPYYGFVYYENGVKYAGPYETPGPVIRVYDTLQESIK
jgi:hypothetical protein